MKIAVLSDIHDHIWNLEKVLKQIKKEGLEAIIFCGDMCAPFTAEPLASGNLLTYICLGNNDEDQIKMLQRGSEKFIWSARSDEYGVAELDGRRVAYCHYPRLGELLAKTGEYDAVFYGHTHLPNWARHCF